MLISGSCDSGTMPAICMHFIHILGSLLLQVWRTELQTWSDFVTEELTSWSAFVWRVFVRLAKGTTLLPQLHHGEIDVFFIACDLFGKCCTNVVVGMVLKFNNLSWQVNLNGLFSDELLCVVIAALHLAKPHTFLERLGITRAVMGRRHSPSSKCEHSRWPE